MAATRIMEFPRVNFVALLAVLLFLVSIFLPWWGLDASGFGIPISLRWTLWSGPPANSIPSSLQPSQTLATYSPIIGILTVAAAMLALLGTIPRAHRLVIGSAILASLTPIIYAALVNYSVSNSCNGSSNCLSGLFGTRTMLGITLTWGFQPGFYIQIIGAVIAIIAVAFHMTFLKTNLQPIKVSGNISSMEFSQDNSWP